MRKILLASALSIILFSCQKDNETYDPGDNPDIPVISRVVIGGEAFNEFTYNDADLVIEEKSKFYYIRHNYNGDNQLVSSDSYWDVTETGMNRTEWVSPANTPKSVTDEYIYNEMGQLVRINSIRTGDANSEYTEFLYENERIIRENNYNKDVLSGYTELFYDDKGNLVRKLRYFSESGLLQLSTTTEFEFDNMLNPFLAFSRLGTPGIHTNSNNIIKETTTIHYAVDPTMDRIQVVDNSYEYNSEGYPVKVNGITEYIYR